MMKNDIYEIEGAHSAVWATIDQSAVTLMVKFTGFSEQIPFTATPGDPAPHGRELYARILSGEFGSVTSYVAPTEAERAACHNPRLRYGRMALATERAAHWTMMGDTAQADDWRFYYRELYALADTPDWPQVEQWPTPPVGGVNS